MKRTKNYKIFLINLLKKLLGNHRQRQKNRRFVYSVITKSTWKTSGMTYRGKNTTSAGFARNARMILLENNVSQVKQLKGERNE